MTTEKNEQTTNANETELKAEKTAKKITIKTHIKAGQGKKKY